MQIDWKSIQLNPKSRIEIFVSIDFQPICISSEIENSFSDWLRIKRNEILSETFTRVTIVSFTKLQITNIGNYLLIRVINFFHNGSI